MSRIQHQVTATMLDGTQKEVTVAYGFDQVPGFKAGYFFQLYYADEKTGEEVFISNTGFLVGVDKKDVKELAKKYKIKLKPF